MRILLLVGIACAALLVALFAYSSRGGADAADELARAANASTRADTQAAPDASPTAAPAATAADATNGAAPAERAEAAAPDPASARVAPGRIRISAHFVEDVPTIGPDARPPEVIEDQVVTCEVSTAPDDGEPQVLSTELGHTRAGLVVLEFADPGVRPLRVRLGLAGRELGNALRGRHMFSRTDQRAKDNWRIPVKPRKYKTALAQDLLGRPIPLLELQLSYARYDALRQQSTPVEETVATDASGRVALPPTRDDTWRVVTRHSEWIALGSGARRGADRELRWVFARSASLRVNGLEAIAASHARPPDLGALGSPGALEFLGYGGPDAAAGNEVPEYMKRFRAELTRPPELVLDLAHGEEQRLGIALWQDEDSDDVFSMFGKPRFALDRLPAGLRLDATIARLWSISGAVAIESRGERRYRGLVGSTGEHPFVLEPGPAELDLELAPPAPEAEPVEVEDELPFENRFRREAGEHVFIVAPIVANASGVRCAVDMRPSASNPCADRGDRSGWRERNGEHRFELPCEGAWDVFVEVRRPHSCVHVVRGVDVAAKRIEVPIELAPAARVRFTHADANSSAASVVVTWSADPQLGGPRIAPGSYTMSEPARVAGASGADAADAALAAWHVAGWRKLRGGSAAADLPSGVPIEFEVSGTHASGHLFLPLRFGPVVLGGGAYQLAIADSLTGSIDVVLASTAAALDVTSVAVADAAGRPLAFRAGGGSDWTHSADTGGIGATSLRGVTPGEVTVVVTHRDGKRSEHPLRVERGATARLVLGQP